MFLEDVKRKDPEVRHVISLVAGRFLIWFPHKEKSLLGQIYGSLFNFFTKICTSPNVQLFPVLVIDNFKFLSYSTIGCLNLFSRDD